MEFIIKKYDELTVGELFDIYKLRCAVFIVEQKCPYQDVDDADKVAMHLMAKDENGLQGYLRVLPAGATMPEVSIGRVIAVKRGYGLGEELMRKGIEIAQATFNAPAIKIEAQTYVAALYEKCGFERVSEEFMLDGIPHVEMLFSAKA
ncbi:MAG: GNAT family N-acetyltransferase [Akkermansia muciniphila]|jgi:ElaA protein|uniref:GNAT family N-acetyltransferase n=1 Tax=Akkermansia muciniphila TaxID=239935 RepID=UPI0025926DEA|nr:GNAT family N-acetyltransferase [uncultured Akkermansia sp.]